MKIFHGVVDGASLESLALMPHRLSIQLSAYSYHKRRARFHHQRALFGYAKEVMVNNGLMWAWNEGATDWVNAQDSIIECARSVGAHYTVMVDVPMEPNLLRTAGLSDRLAMAKTLENAKRFLDTDLPGKIFVVQGWREEDYLSCIEAYRHIGVFDADCLIGIGTLFPHQPPRLYEIVDFVCRHLPVKKHVHCFGIWQGKRVKTLAGLGVDSCSTAMATTAGIMNEAINEQGRINVGPQQTDAFMTALLIARNQLALEMNAKTAEPERWR